MLSERLRGVTSALLMDLKCPYYAIFKVAYIVLSVLKEVYMHPRSKNTLVFSKNSFDFTSFLNDS